MRIHCVRKKVNPTQCTTEMWNLNASCVNFVRFIVRYSVKYAQNCIWKYCLTTELSIFNIKDKYFAVSSTANCSHSVTFRRSHINSKRGVFRKRLCLNLNVGPWERICAKKLIAEFSNKMWTLKQMVVEDWHRRHYRKEAWQQVEPGKGQLLTKRSSSGIHVFELAFEHTGSFWT